MSISLGVANGFKVETIEEGEKIRFNVEHLLNGEKLTEIPFECSSSEEKEDIIAEYFSAVMYKCDVEREIPDYERKRLAKKMMALNIVTGYKIVSNSIYTEIDVRNITVEILKNGEFLACTKMESISDHGIEMLKDQLNNMVHYNLDIRHQTRPIYLEEILAVIKQ